MERTSQLLSLLTARADTNHDGHLTIMKFTTNWRVGFGTVSDRDDIGKLAEGSTFEDAAGKVLANPTLYKVF